MHQVCKNWQAAREHQSCVLAYNWADLEDGVKLALDVHVDLGNQLVSPDPAHAQRSGVCMHSTRVK
jgi:hypothetical protein